MTLAFPIRGTINGVAIVIIPEAEYAGLQNGTPQPDAVAVDPAIARVVDRFRPFGGARSRIERDRPVALFLAEASLSMRMAEAPDACLARFGAERTPSVSRISRYWKRLREG